MPQHDLCRLNDIPDGGSAGFTVAETLVLAVRQGDAVYAYVNSCPHIGTPLDIKSGEFLNQNRSHILCTTHGALFRIEDGYCISGPCAGSNLMALHAIMEKGEIFISLPKPKRVA